MPNHLSKYVLVILSLSLSIQARANPTPSPIDTQFTSPLAQTATRGLSQVSTDALTVIASFLPTDQISRLACSKKEFTPLLGEVLLSPENEVRFKAEFISAFKKLRKRLFPDMTSYEIDLEQTKLENFAPGFFSYSQLYVFTKLYYHLAFERNSLNQSDPSLNEFYNLNLTTYPQEIFNREVENELSRFTDGCLSGCAIGTGLGFLFWQGCVIGAGLRWLYYPTALGAPILGTTIGGLRNSSSLKHFLRNSCVVGVKCVVAGATCAIMPVLMPVLIISDISLRFYDCFCPLNRETFPGSHLDNGEARINKAKTVLTQMSQNIRNVPTIYSILKPFIFERPPTEDERTRINQDIEFLSSIPQMREVLIFAGAIDLAQQPIANEVRIDILSDDDHPSDNDNSLDLHSHASESQPLLRRM